jgi:hypothetical protein
MLLPTSKPKGKLRKRPVRSRLQAFWMKRRAPSKRRLICTWLRGVVLVSQKTQSYIAADVRISNPAIHFLFQSFLLLFRLWAAWPTRSHSTQGQGIFLSSIVPRPFPGFTQPPTQRVAGASFSGVKRPGRETDNLLPFNTKVNNSWSYTCTPHTSSCYGA